jgi:hypothetical protein
MTEYDSLSFIERSEEIVNVNIRQNSDNSKNDYKYSNFEAATIIQRAWRRYIVNI